MHRSVPRTQESEDAARALVPLPDLSVVRILAVDDDPQAAALIEIALANAPFERTLEVAPTAAEGFRQIARDEHDIYLVDQQLPDGSGVDLIRKATAKGTRKPFILITGHGSGDLDEAALRGGAADYVEKHLLGTHLARSIRYALRSAQTARMLLDREEHLLRADKMDAIGRLAGGVAHDFNNLLTAIIGYTDLVAERLDRGEPMARDVNEIRRAADRAAALTRQLLAFGRRQFLAPEVLDLNTTVSGLMPMLPRVVGERVETSTLLAHELRRVKADPGQMEQVLVNLVLNACDAMPMGGLLSIDTSNVELDEERVAAERLALAVGQYVMLNVRDTGSGMDADTLAHAFEPFFTTKPKDKGVGFGLATVYGIIEQSNGAISVDTAPGRGTSIRIYLPVTDAEAPVESRPELKPALSGGGGEMLLVVEDDDAVRDLASRALRNRGYTVHEHANAEEAIQWALGSREKPDLLVTDVVMPGLSGPNLAARLLQEYPRMRVLYMSGYTEDATAVHGAFWGGIPLLQKPFTPAQLAERVRRALDGTVDRG